MRAHAYIILERTVCNIPKYRSCALKYCDFFAIATGLAAGEVGATKRYNNLLQSARQYYLHVQQRVIYNYMYRNCLYAMHSSSSNIHRGKCHGFALIRGARASEEKLIAMSAKKFANRPRKVSLPAHIRRNKIESLEPR